MRQLTETQQKIYDFVSLQHGTQVRKYTGEPYVNHCLEVAELVYKYTGSESMWAAAMCHDLLEDTKCDVTGLIVELNKAGMYPAEYPNIISLVQNLTDKYTSDKYPSLNRQQCKFEEAIRLGYFGPRTHTIKYADIISNTRSIVAYDSKFALTYLPEKVQLLHYMRKGDINLYIQACAEVYEGLRSVGLLENYKFSV